MRKFNKRFDDDDDNGGDNGNIFNNLPSPPLLPGTWRSCAMPRGVVVSTTAQLHSTKPELRLCAGSNPAHGVSEIRNGEDL